MLLYLRIKGDNHATTIKRRIQYLCGQAGAIGFRVQGQYKEKQNELSRRRNPQRNKAS